MQASYMSYAQAYFESETNTRGFYKNQNISYIQNSIYGSALQLANISARAER